MRVREKQSIVTRDEGRGASVVLASEAKPASSLRLRGEAEAGSNLYFEIASSLALLAPRNDGGEMARNDSNKPTGQPANRPTQNGFTLIELMIVVIIIAALAAMIAPRLAGRSEQAKVAVAQADISSNIGTALKLYELDNGSYPPSGEGLNALRSRPASGTAYMNWKGPYLERDPIDPWGSRYQYRYPGTHNVTGYDLYSVGQDGLEGTEDDVGNW